MDPPNGLYDMNSRYIGESMSAQGIEMMFDGHEPVGWAARCRSRTWASGSLLLQGARCAVFAMVVCIVN